VASGEVTLHAAQELGIPPATAYRWVGEARVSGLLGAERKKERLELVGAILDAQLSSILTMSHILNDPAYLVQQNARDLGIAYGILCDKAARLVDGLERPLGADDDAGGSADLDGAAPPGAVPGGE